jgi:hypothetical protein
MRRRRVPIFPMLMIAVSVTITVALSFGITRYRAPVDVVLPVLAAVAIDALWRRRDRPVDVTPARDDHDDDDQRAPVESTAIPATAEQG